MPTAGPRYTWRSSRHICPYSPAVDTRKTHMSNRRLRATHTCNTPLQVPNSGYRSETDRTTTALVPERGTEHTSQNPHQNPPHTTRGTRCTTNPFPNFFRTPSDIGSTEHSTHTRVGTRVSENQRATQTLPRSRYRFSVAFLFILDSFATPAPLIWAH